MNHLASLSRLKRSFVLLLTSAIGVSLIIISFNAVASITESSQYEFDDKLLMGSSLGGGQISRFNHPDQVDAGTYYLDLYVNGNYISRDAIEFKVLSNSGTVGPCFSEIFFTKKIGVKFRESTQDKSEACPVLDKRIPGSTFKIDIARLRLDLSIPQAELNVRPRDYVSSEDLDAGETMAFVNYDGNIYKSEYGGTSSGSSTYSYLGLNSGINFGLWRLRHQSSYSQSNFGVRTRNNWNSIRTYAQRAIPSLRSELTIGDNFTEGNLFGSLAYRGVRLASDDRMLPDSMRNYAPIIRGVAKTNARVVVSQNGKKIYETNIPPGAFSINDLYGANYAGALDVQVIEADGSVSSFTVPFSSVPESMRPGLSRYSASVGSARAYDRGNNLFADLSYQRGISNRLTINSGAQIADDYFALLGGAVVATDFGAFGFNSTFSSARVENNERKKGWRMGINYSRTFQATATTLTLAGYRYSTEGYRELGDVLGIRAYQNDGVVWNSSSYKQRNQFTVLLSQRLGDYGSFYLSGSTNAYYGGRSRNRQLQFGYSNSYRSLSYSISYAKQRSTYYNQFGDGIARPDGIFDSFGNVGRKNNTLMLTLSIPLGGGSRFPTLNSSTSRRSGESSGILYQAGLNGTAGKEQNFSYGITASHDSDGIGTGWSGTVQQRFPLVTVGAGYASGDNYKQINANLRGAMVAHREGLTFGPYVGDTFALIEAKGASGAAIRSGQGAKVNSDGYAVAPSLTPYRYNPISLDSKGINEKAELLESERKVAPYAGATLRVKFKTVFGQALLISARLADGKPLPLGADVLDSSGVNIGVVGQGGQVYLRSDADRGSLQVIWGDTPDARCDMLYNLKGKSRDQTLIRLDATCTRH